MRSAVAALVYVATATAPAAPALTLAQLKNFTYALGESSSVEGGKVTLVDGRWKDPEGSQFSLLPQHALGDLDGDGSADALALLSEDTGGTGRFIYLFALLNHDGVPRQMAEPEWLGDRSVIERLTIDRKGIVAVRYLTHNDGDAACCPTLRIDDRYRVQAGRLVGILK